MKGHFNGPFKYALKLDISRELIQFVKFDPSRDEGVGLLLRLPCIDISEGFAP